MLPCQVVVNNNISTLLQLCVTDRDRCSHQRCVPARATGAVYLTKRCIVLVYGFTAVLTDVRSGIHVDHEYLIVTMSPHPCDSLAQQQAAK